MPVIIRPQYHLSPSGICNFSRFWKYCLGPRGFSFIMYLWVRGIDFASFLWFWYLILELFRQCGIHYFSFYFTLFLFLLFIYRCMYTICLLCGVDTEETNTANIPAIVLYCKANRFKYTGTYHASFYGRRWK
jgi:hypothetical protein